MRPASPARHRIFLADDGLRNSAQVIPDKVACVAAGHRVSYADLDMAANRLAHALVEGGVRTGDRVAVFLENGIEAVTATFGVWRAGGILVMVNPGTKADKLRYMVEDCGVSAIICTGGSPAVQEALAGGCRTVRCVLGCGGSQATLEDLLQSRATTPPRRSTIDVDVAAIVYTSGSTGKPKGVVMSHQNMVSACRSINDYLENGPEDVILDVLPLSFGYGLFQVLMAAEVGATLVVERSFAYPYHIVQVARAERVTAFPAVPTILAMLLKMKHLDPSDFDTVRCVTNAGAGLPVAHVRRLPELFRYARIFSMYGITEAVRISYMPPEELQRKPSSVGLPIPNTAVEVVDATGHPVGPGEVGELVVRSASVMQGYWGQPDETRRVLRTGRHPWDRVLYTGDLFKRDEEGYLYFVSRKDDIIKSRGQKVSPREVEEVICQLPQVQEVAVVGVPDEVMGQAVKAFVVTAAGEQLSELAVVRHCATRLEAHMVPASVEFCEALPRSVNGKVQRKALVEPELLSGRA